MEHSNAPIARADFLWTLAGACHLQRVPFDAALAAERFPPPDDRASLIQALEALGLEPASQTPRKGRVTDEALPALAWLAAPTEPSTVEAAEAAAATDSIESEEPTPTARPALIVRGDADTLTYFHPDSEAPQSIARGEFAAHFEPTIVTLRAAEAPLRDDSADAEAKRPFGFRDLIPELLRHKGIWRDVLLASFAIQCLALATPLFTQVIIDKVIVHHTLNTLGVIAVGLFMFMAFGAAMTWVRQYLVIHTGNRIDAVLASRVFAHLFELPVRYFEHRPTGTLVARIQGIETIRQFLSGAAVTLFLDIPFLFVFLAVMFYYSATLTYIVLAILAAIAIVSLAITPALRRRLNRQFLLGARNQAFVTEYVSGMDTVKALQMEPQLNRRYGDYLSSYLDANFKARSLANTYNVAANGLEQVQTLAVLTVGALTVMQNPGFTVGMLVAFSMFASRLAQPVLRLVGLWQEFQQARIAVRRLGDIMDAPREPYRAVPARTRGGTGGAIVVEGLTFRYGDDQPNLYEALDLSVEAGACAAIMGPSGSGKSTLAKLLMGFYRPSAGRIQLDGYDIRHLAANELRAYFGVVPQETVLFSGTVYENLLAANPNATFEQVVAACRMADIHATLEALPQGYQTELGEHGVGLSGGQRQRLAIARALLKRPKVLVFDEATSHLDAATAEQIARTVNGLKGKVTILFITHQLPKGLAVDQRVWLGGPETPAPAQASTTAHDGEGSKAHAARG